MNEKISVNSPISDTGNPVLRPVPNKGIWNIFLVFILVFLIVFFLLKIVADGYKENSKLGVIRTAPISNEEFDAPIVIRTFPSTIEGIHVFNDQMATWEMSEEQFKFAATHYAGTQKVFASDARRLRAHNPDFIILNYRLGMGLGYQSVTGDCSPNGSWLEVIEGEKWIREYPDDPPDEWFFKLDGQRVFFCEWGWYLMDLTNPSWREYWSGELLRQLNTNLADGVFVDGLFPPNFYGSDKFKPHLPEKDELFENTWSTNIEDFIDFTQSGELSNYHLIANVGHWVTGREKTDYSASDGILVEGFSRWADGQYFSTTDGDWQLQLDRILNLVNLDKVVLLQQYVDSKNVGDRLFILSNYLLVKGQHTFINMEYSGSPEWFPEYEVEIGKPTGEIPGSISSLWRSDWQVYARPYSNGLVLVNPSENARTVELFQKYYQTLPFGGGVVPSNGDISDWAIDYAEVTNVKIDPHSGVILLNKIPTK